MQISEIKYPKKVHCRSQDILRVSFNLFLDLGFNPLKKGVLQQFFCDCKCVRVG